jgi:dTDP-4-dehydrorhamnose reductase
MRGENFHLAILRQVASGREIHVVNDQMGTPTWCCSIASATTRILAGLLERIGQTTRLASVQETYHIAAAGWTTWYGFAQAIVAQTAHRTGLEARVARRAHDAIQPVLIPVTTAQWGAPAPRPANSRLDCSKLARDFGVSLADWKEDLGLCLQEGAVCPDEGSA